MGRGRPARVSKFRGWTVRAEKKIRAGPRDFGRVTREPWPELFLVARGLRSARARSSVDRCRNYAESNAISRRTARTGICGRGKNRRESRGNGSIENRFTGTNGAADFLQTEMVVRCDRKRGAR